MSATDELRRLGYSLRFDYSDKAKYDYPSLVFERITSYGYHVEHLVFDTFHGGGWTFEKHTVAFIPKDEENWTMQELLELNSASRDFIGCDKGYWALFPSVMTADECRAIADYIDSLERKAMR